MHCDCHYSKGSQHHSSSYSDDFFGHEQQQLNLQTEAFRRLPQYGAYPFLTALPTAAYNGHYFVQEALPKHASKVRSELEEQTGPGCSTWAQTSMPHAHDSRMSDFVNESELHSLDMSYPSVRTAVQPAMDINNFFLKNTDGNSLNSNPEANDIRPIQGVNDCQMRNRDQRVASGRRLVREEIKLIRLVNNADSCSYIEPQNGFDLQSLHSGY